MEKVEEAIPFIREIVFAEAGDEKRRWQQILLSQYMRLNWREEAESYAERLVTEDPLHPDWWKTLAYLKLERSNYVETLVSMMIYSKLTPLTLKERKLMASLYLSIDVPIQASRIYKNIAGEVVDKDTVDGLTQSYSRLYQPDKVIKWITIGLEEYEDETLRLLRANLFFREENYEKAIKDYNYIVGLNPENGEAWLMMGYARLNLNQFNKAIESFEMAKQFPRQEKSASSMLERLYARK